MDEMRDLTYDTKPLWGSTLDLPYVYGPPPGPQLDLEYTYWPTLTGPRLDLEYTHPTGPGTLDVPL